MGYRSNRDGVPRSGEFLDDMLTKIEDLAPATASTTGLMSAADKAKLNTLEDDEELTIAEIANILT